MKIQSLLTWFGAMLILLPLSVHAAEPTAPTEAKSASCALLKPADLTTLLGEAAEAKPTGDACSWTVSGSTNKLNILKYKNSGMAAEMAFAGARKNAAKNGTVISQRGLGDNAFALMQPVGVVLLAIKNGQMVQLQYWSGKAGTDKDLEALVTVAKKAIEGF